MRTPSPLVPIAIRLTRVDHGSVVLEARGTVRRERCPIYSLLQQAPTAWRPPQPPRTERKSTRQLSIRWLCSRPPEDLKLEEQPILEQVLAEDEGLATGYQLLQRFWRLGALEICTHVPAPTDQSVRVSCRENHPGAAVDELTHRVEVAGVDRSLGDHMQDDFPESVKPKVAEEVGPPGRGRI